MTNNNDKRQQPTTMTNNDNDIGTATDATIDATIDAATTREQPLTGANEVLKTTSYKRGQFENFNLLGVPHLCVE